jgi:subtilase family serine protease
MSRKRKRNNDVGEIDHELIIDYLDENPYLYRSIQAIIFVGNNPLYNNDSIVNEKTLYLYIANYFKAILAKFFTFDGKELIILDETLNEEDRISYESIFDMGFMDEDQINSKFSYFMDNMKIIIFNFMTLFIDPSKISIMLCSEGEYLRLGMHVM